LTPGFGLGMAQLWTLVSFFVLQRHNLFLLRVYRKDYLFRPRRKMKFLPQGDSNVPTTPARDRMMILAEKILQQLKIEDDLKKAAAAAERASAELPLDAAAGEPSPLETACTTVSSLVQYLKDSSCGNPPKPCDLFDICTSTIQMCRTLTVNLPQNKKCVLTFAGRQRFLPLRVLLVDDIELNLKRLQLLMRNRGYHYECCYSAGG
jgi:hypothetical protein